MIRRPVYADGKLDLQAEQNVSNQQGLIAAKQALSIKGQALNNQKGQINLNKVMLI